MASTKQIIYWDTCIWLAWIKNEKRKPGEIEGIQEQVEQFERDEIFLATSVLSLTEMLDLQNKLSAAGQRKFQGFFRHPKLVRIAADLRVAELARDLRDYYFLQHQQDGLPTIELGDAIHLASALHLRVNRFMTFDERDSKNPKHPRRGLINLSGNVAGHKLKIERPMVLSAQMALQLVPPPVAPNVGPSEAKAAAEDQGRPPQD